MKIPLIVFGVILLTSFLIGCVAWTYSFNTIAMMFDSTASIVWWQGGLIGLVPYLGQVSLPVMVIVWLCSLFIG